MFGNWIKTTILMAGIVALFGAMGAAIGGQQGMLIALVMGGAMNFWAYWFSDKMVLKMYKAREVDAASSPYLYNMVRELAQRAELPMPKVYLIDEAQPNAFATGRNPDNAAVAATTGIMRMLSERELRGVRGDEVAIIFQEPMTAPNPLYTIGNQIGEVLQLKKGLTGAQASAGVVELLADHTVSAN